MNPKIKNYLIQPKMRNALLVLLAIINFIVPNVSGLYKWYDASDQYHNILDDVFSLTLNNSEAEDLCPCEDEIYCQPLGVASERNSSSPHVQKYLAKQTKSEVFAFVLKCNYSTWGKFNWDKLTTIALSGFYDSHLTCFAHKHGVQVVKLANIPVESLPDPDARTEWVKIQARQALLNFLDGINLDFEDILLPNTPEQKGYTELVKESAAVFHKYFPKSQVTVDVAWSALGIDQRYYDYAAIAEASDFIFVMSYDEQSQIWDSPCSARPNSGVYKTAAGLMTYLNLGVPPHKIILGLPWYGYNYPCLSIDKANTCYLKKVPFRGCNCSDAAGKEYSFHNIMNIKNENKAVYMWDKFSSTPYFNYKDKLTGHYHQIRYDDQRSLPYKYMLAVFYKLRGVGMWTANFLDYSDTPAGESERTSMWDLLP